MAIYMRRTGIPDNYITNVKINTEAGINISKLNTDSADFDGDGVIKNDKIIEQKIANLAITTQKLQDQAVTLAKAQQALKIHHFTGNEDEETVIGTSEAASKYFKIVKSSANTKGIQPQTLHINAEMKVLGATGAEGFLKVYIDEEVSPRITVSTTSDAYEMQEGEADISDLENGAHDVTIKMVTDDAAATVYNDLIEIFFEK